MANEESRKQATEPQEQKSWFSNIAGFFAALTIAPQIFVRSKVNATVDKALDAAKTTASEAKTTITEKVEKVAELVDDNDIIGKAAMRTANPVVGLTPLLPQGNAIRNATDSVAAILDDTIIPKAAEIVVDTAKAGYQAVTARDFIYQKEYNKDGTTSYYAVIVDHKKNPTKTKLLVPADCDTVEEITAFEEKNNLKPPAEPLGMGAISNFIRNHSVAFGVAGLATTFLGPKVGELIINYFTGGFGGSIVSGLSKFVTAPIGALMIGSSLCLNPITEKICSSIGVPTPYNLVKNLFGGSNDISREEIAAHNAMPANITPVTKPKDNVLIEPKLSATPPKPAETVKLNSALIPESGRTTTIPNGTERPSPVIMREGMTISSYPSLPA